MKKIIMIFLGFSLTAFGMSYAKFKKHTLKHAKVLQSQELDVQKIKHENNIALRTPNPTLGVEVGRYDPEFSGAAYGYRISASQTVRTHGYLDALSSKAKAHTLLSRAYVKEGKAKYIKSLEDLYTEYVYASKMLSLLKQEIKLSSKMMRVAKERYVNGSETKVSYLQAKTQTLTLKTQMHTTKQKMNSLYYKLLAQGGFSKKVSLSKKFIYSVSNKNKRSKKLNTQQKILLAKEKLYASQIRMHENHFNSYDISTELEKEPEQSILRLGISLPLPLRHNKEEEKALARLKLAQLKLDQGQFSLDMKSQKKMFKSSIRELSQQYHALKNLKKEQQSLTHLLTEGYNIAQGSLFELMLTKNRLIQTKKSLLLTHKEINHMKIALRLIQGDYGD